MTPTSEVVFHTAAALLSVKCLYQIGVGMVHFRAGVRGVRINVSPVVAIDPPLLLIITFVAAVMAMLTSVVAGSYLSWGVLYRARLLCGFRARAKGASDKT